VPIILIQHLLSAPVSSSGTSRELNEQNMHGWTLITPPGWGMPFLSSIFTGSRIGGLHEVKSQAIESGLPYFPDNFSGTELGQQAQESIGKESKEKWDRIPPAKRASFETLGTLSPFEPDWNVVCGINQAQAPEEGFEQTQRMEEDPIKLWLLYGQNTREVVAEALAGEDPAVSLLRSIDAARLSRNLPSLNIEGPKLYQGALVLVKVTMCGRGTPTDMSALYDISEEEAVAWSSKSKHPEKEAYEV
jgi:ribonuclease P/MRP protein subunit POP1